jgi:CheY-like chemotaxis protein
VLRTLLQQGGIDPVIVENGVEALAAWERENWDVVLMDIQMPVMDGVSATRAIRSREAATGRARTPILAVTANAMAHQLETYHAAGIDGVVPKPLVIDQLFAALHHALEPEAAVAEPVPGLAER